jgi:hypothetical protein
MQGESLEITTPSLSASNIERMNSQKNKTKEGTPVEARDMTIKTYPAPKKSRPRDGGQTFANWKTMPGEKQKREMKFRDG